MRVKEQSEKGGLEVNIQKNKIMTSNSITSWQIDGGKLEIVTNFIFFGSKINAERVTAAMILRHFLLGRKAMTNLL